MIAELHPVFPFFSPGYSNTALSFSCKLCLTPTLLPGVLCDHLTWTLNGQPAQVTHLMYYRLAHVNTSGKINETGWELG